jgi:hypothetical protein
MKRIAIAILFLACLTARAQSPQTPCNASTINTAWSDSINNVQYLCTTAGWKPNTGIGAPTVACSAVNYGITYTDVQGSATYTCGSTGWFIGGGDIGTGVVSVSGASPIASTGGTTPQISINPLSGSQVTSLFSLATGCATSGYVLSPASGTCVPGGILYPSSNGVVFNTSTSTARNATSSDINTLYGYTPVSPSGSITGSAGSLSGASALPNGTTATTQTTGDATTQVATDQFVIANALALSSIPATTSVLKGSGSAGSALAATPGTDYVIPSGNVATATAAASAGTPCSYGNAPTGVDAHWNSINCAPISVGSTTNALTMNNSGSGAASGSTFNGSAAETISYNTIGAASSGANSNITSLTGLTTPLSAAQGGTGISTASSTGIAQVASGTWSVAALTAGQIPAGIPIANVGSAGLSGTSPVTISSGGAIGCATCVTSAASLTANELVIGSGSQGSQTTALTGYVYGNGTSAPTASTTIPISGLATIGANTTLANVTGSTAAPTAATIPSGVQYYTAGTGYSTATGAQLPTSIPIASVGTAGLSGTSPVTISAAGAIGCATCIVAASNPSAGVATFAGSTQTISSEAQVTAAQGGTGISTSSSTGVPQVSSGTWSVSTTLPSGLSATNLTLTTPSLGAATATSLLATGIVDGQAPVTITTGSSASLGGTYNSGYTINEEGTAATAVTYTLPTAAAGKQYCVANGYNGSAANTGTLELLTSATGQFIIFTDGTLSATGGYVISGGVAGDKACVVGVDSTHWMLYVQSGSWAKH